LVTKATRAFVRERAKSRCEYYRAPEIVTGGPFEVDHIIPQASTGGDEVDNLALCCNSCNTWKADHMFRHRSGNAPEDSAFQPAPGCLGRAFSVRLSKVSAAGQNGERPATIDRLRMNSTYQIEARKYWVEAKLYP
jgi:hypothetical protein